MKYQNQNHLQKQLTALSHQLFTQKKKVTTDIQLGSEYASKIEKHKASLTLMMTFSK